jgi:hypothetical protein
VVDYELLAAPKEIGQCELAVGTVESVILFDFDVRELAELFSEGVARFDVFFLFLEKDFAGGDPFVMCNTLYSV